MYEVLNTFKWKPNPKFQWNHINFEEPQKFPKTPNPWFQKHEMHEWERIRSLPSEEKLEKPSKILENQDRSEIGEFLGEKQRSIEREIDGNEDWIAHGLYIGKPVILDRWRYRQVSRYLSRRCQENTCRQLRCRGGIEDQHTRIKNRSSIDPPGIEKLSSIQTQSR